MVERIGGSGNKLQRQKQAPLELRREKGRGSKLEGEVEGDRKGVRWVPCPKGF